MIEEEEEVGLGTECPKTGSMKQRVHTPSRAIYYDLVMFLKHRTGQAAFLSNRAPVDISR